jgi:hypothetical protein
LEEATVGTQAAYYTLRSPNGMRYVLSHHEIAEAKPIAMQTDAFPARPQQLKLF